MKLSIRAFFGRSLIYICLFVIVGGQRLIAQHLSYKTAFSNDEYIHAVHSGRMLIDSLMSAQNIPGVQIAVSVEGKKAWSQGFGYAYLENKVRMWPSTKMRIGSVSKTLTSAALGKLLANDELNIDLPVQKYVPYFP